MLQWTSEKPIRSFFARIQGIHHPSWIERFITIFIFGTISITQIYIFTEAFRQHIQIASITGVALLVFFPLSSLLIIGFIIFAISRKYTISDDIITFHTPWVLGSWTIRRADIQAIFYRRDQGDSRRLTFLLKDGSRQDAMCTRSMRRAIEG